MKLLKNFSKYIFGTFLTLLVGLITTPIITRLVSPTDMGKYSMFITAGELTSALLFLGFDQSFVRFYNDESADQQSKLLLKCLGAPVIAFVLAAILLLPFNESVSFFIAGEKSFSIYQIFIVYTFCLIINRFTLMYIRMQQRALTYSIINVLQKLFYVAFAIILVYVLTGNSFLSLVLAMVYAEIGTLLLTFVLNVKNYKALVHKTKKLNTSIRSIAHFGAPFIFSSTINQGFKATDKVMLNMLSDYSEIGLYSGALNIISLLNAVQNSFSMFWTPVAYERYKVNGNDKNFFLLMNQCVTFVMLIIAIVLILLKDVIVLFLGTSYRDAAYIFPFLVFMPVMYTISETTVLGINFAKKTKYHINISVISGLCNIFGNYFLIRFFGAKGAAISTGLSYIVFFAMRSYYSNLFLNIDFRLKTFYLCVFLVYLFAIYASFNNFNFIMVIIAALLIFVLSLAYRNVISLFTKQFKIICANILKK